MSGRSTPVAARARRDDTCRDDARRRSLIAAIGFLLCASAISLPTRWVRAQVVMAVAPAKPAGANPATDHGFSIVYDDRLSDSLSKFEELVRSRAWEKAFRILADIPEDKWSSMLPDKNGLIRPAAVRIRDTILELPADGREAFRLFFDAKARVLFNSIRTAEKEDDVRIARTIYDRYFITSVGDRAADRLADDSFERGDYVEAARCWKSIFDFHPSTTLSEPKLLLKRAIALYRAGARDEFHNVRRLMTRDFPNARVVLGGKEVAADDYLKELDAPGTPTGGPPALEKSRSVPVFSGLAPPDSAGPAWQFRFLEAKDIAALEESMRNWYGAPAVTTIVPAAVTDGERIYGNWLGACFAVDAATGKTVWSNSPDIKSLVGELKSNNGRMVLYSTNTAQFALALGNGVLLSVAAPRDQIGRFRLAALNPASGVELWSTDRSGSALAQASFIGTPLIEGHSVYAISHQVAEGERQPGPFNAVAATELVLRHLDLRTGNELWSVPLGTPQLVGDADWGQQSLPVPALVLSRDRLYVLTNDGALLAVNLGRHRLEWAFKYEPPATSGNRQRFFRAASLTGRHCHSTGPIVVRDGVIYFKESTGSTLYAVEESGPRLKWKWQDSEFANLIGIDADDIYLFSNELSAISRSKPETRWSNRLTVDLQGIGAHVGSRGVLVFTPRGLFELSKESGDVRRIFRGADLGAAGGFVMLAGKHLVTVSNMAITAYPDGPSGSNSIPKIRPNSSPQTASH